MEEIKNRGQIDDQFKWHLQDIYASTELWELDFAQAKQKIPTLSEFAGTLTSPEAIAKALETQHTVSRLLEKLLVYARMHRDEDGSAPMYQAMSDRIMSLSVAYSSATSYFVPELLALEPKRLDDFMQADVLATYKLSLQQIVKERAHVLSANEERLLAQTGEMAEAPDTIFSMLDNTDMRFPTIHTADGDVELTSSTYVMLMQSRERAVRKEAFEAFYKTYGQFKNTYAAMLSSSVKANVFYADVRKYDGPLQASLSANDVSVWVYDNLIAAIREKLPAMYKYMRLRKRILGVDELHMYDIYTPLVEEEIKLTYEQACAQVKAGCAPLGEEYGKLLDSAFQEGWIDVYENRGKRSGAYCWGSFDTHPFVLLNYKSTLNDVFTIAHELGHAMHSYYSDSANPYHLAQYSIFTAEVASTVNEALLNDYLVKTQDDPKKKLRLLNYYLEQFRTTVFRQVMFAEFEKWTHEMAQSGVALTAEAMSEKYLQLNRDYYGQDVVIDEQIGLEWARIPHFYNAFYVYKYATGFTTAVALARDILSGKTENYLAFLKSGGNDYPIEQLKKAGVDLTTTAPIIEALEVFEQKLDEFERLLAK